jgi:hypothetical protein
LFIAALPFFLGTAKVQLILNNTIGWKKNKLFFSFQLKPKCLRLRGKLLIFLIQLIRILINGGKMIPDEPLAVLPFFY